LWLDTDLWFRSGAGAPSAAVFAPSPLPSFGPAPGLVASRLRRAAWKQRRYARRARATAIALSPAVMLVLAGLRSAGDPRASLAMDDPPSLTYRITSGKIGLAEIPSHVRSERPATHHRRARAEAAPRIAWHHATSVGLPYGGSLVDGTQLPIEGPNWVTWDPVTDSVPNLPHRLYGNERTIRTILRVTAAYRAAHPKAPRVVIGDISREGGGPMTDEHVSHQNGLDVDVYFPRRDHLLRSPVSTDQIDRRLAQDLLDRFVAAGAQMVFVGFSTGLHGPAGVVIPYPGHENHMHVRFPPPGG
jgi:hypothetical protein